MSTRSRSPSRLHELEAGRLSGGRESFLAYSDELAEGVKLGPWRRSWEPGGEVGTTTQEHGGVLMPLGILRHRHGVKISFADVGDGDAEQALDAFATAIRPGV